MSEHLHIKSYGPVVPQSHTFSFPEEGFALECGKTLPEVTIRFETYGTLNAAGDNAVWICSPLTADAHVAGYYTPEDKKAGWWDALIGKGKAIDTDRFFVVCSNILGGCQGTTGPGSIDPRTGKPYGSRFPEITIGDMVVAQKLLADHLNVQKLYAVVGGSMGGFQAMKWAIYYPGFVDRCVIIASSPRFSSQALGFEIVGRSVIRQDPHFNGGDYYETQIPETGLANARKLAHLTYLSPESMEKKFPRESGTGADPENFKLGIPLESYLDYQGKKFVERFDANSYLHITYATDTFDLETEYGSLEKAFAPIQAEVLNISLSTDWLFPPEDSLKITYALLNTNKKVSSLELDSKLGHDGFLIEVGNLGKAIGRFLNTKIRKNSSPETGLLPAFSDNRSFSLLEKMIPAGSRILDLGCGNGRLLETLQARGISGVGVEKNFKSILDCLETGVPVIQRDLDESGLSHFDDASFDYVVFNRTLQEVREPLSLIHEILRVAGRAIITFPNFGHWSVRAALCRYGRMPKSDELPYEWYNTPNIHLFTLQDFIRMCESEKIRIDELVAVNEKPLSRFLTALGKKNLGAEQVVALVSGH